MTGSPASAEAETADSTDCTGEDYASECSSGLPCHQPTDGHMLEWQFQKLPPLVTVKNTFIDGWAEEEEDQGIPMVAAKSCPAPKLHTFQDDADDASPRYSCLLGRLPPDAPVKAHQLAVQYLPNPSPDALPAYVWPQRLAAELQPGIQTSVPEPEPLPKQATVRKLPSHVTPLESRGPETSLGSALHEAGDCRPCAWFWRPQGCNNGQECRHCHLCLQGEVKARRKSKLVSIRKQTRLASTRPRADVD